MTTGDNSDVILEANGILKQYPGNTALDRIHYTVYRGCVNVLIGENGAGKSTLMRILAGVEVADSGRIILDGEEIVLRSPRDATDKGIAIVHQELAVLPNLDVSENIFAGRELTLAGTVVDRVREDERSAAALGSLQKPIPVTKTLDQLSLGNRQVVELARTLAHGAKILILDEPTSALSKAETDSLFAVIEDLRKRGVTIIYISHRLHELIHLGNHFTVLRSGRIVGQAPRGKATRQWIVERMSGRADTSGLMERKPRPATEVVLRVEGLAVSPVAHDGSARSPVHDVSFHLMQGEVLGIYGLLGAGRTELMEALAGAGQTQAGKFVVHGREIRIASVAQAVKAGIVLVPEDRQRDGLVPELSIRENIVLAAAGEAFLSKSSETERVRRFIQDLKIAARDLELPVTSLSGGNQQKVLLARCLMRSPKVLLLDEPTRGVDVGAKAEIYRILRTLAADGLSVIFTSSEVEETRVLADRAIVLCQGRIAADLQFSDITDEALFTAASPQVTKYSVAAGASA